ncbi:hypothetical protein PsYK624_004140 [Phanerochaete sordida]|uniref:Uncharacterized protein n=1 Tax=Phanerochaete sordida TaxID=48140 RepID=A0A9P3FXE8_9APHY|nr:hypothetical protein PsYK624_004140 [Phanerochaete sordida]
MNLFTIINPRDFGGLQVREGQDSLSSGPQPQDHSPARRSARPRGPSPSPPPSRASSRPARARGGRGRGATKHRHASRAHVSDRGSDATLQRARRAAASSGAPGPSARGGGPRRSAPAESAPRERIRRARAAAERAAGRGKRVGIMDVILDAQAPTARLDADDLLDAVEQCQRTALALPSAEDDLLADMFVPGRYEARHAAFWQDVTAALEYAPRSLYHVSAERSTAAWDAASDSGGSEPL